MSNIDSIFSDTMGIGNPPSTSNSNLGIIDVVVPLPNLGVEREPLLPNIVNPITSPVVSTPINTLAPPKKSTDTSPTAGQPTIVQPTIVYNPPKVQEVPKADVPKKQETQTTKQDLPKTNNLVDSKKQMLNRNITIGLAVIGLGGVLYFLARK